jgi:hypothetical protein
MLSRSLIIILSGSHNDYNYSPAYIRKIVNVVDIDFLFSGGMRIASIGIEITGSFPGCMSANRKSAIPINYNA